jgi:two-component system, OmpR family, phosphate regulon response regulator OmpR
MSTLATVLVVEDDAATRDMLGELLALEGYTTARVTDGMSGLARIARGGVDLVLLDLKLPDMDGVEFCRRVRAADQAADVPIVMLSGTVDPQWESAGLAAGADDVMGKPFDIDGLLDRVRAHLPE